MAQAGRDRGLAGVRRPQRQQRRSVAAWSGQGRTRQRCYAVSGQALGPSAAQPGRRRQRPALCAATRMQRVSRCASRGRQGPGPLAATPTHRAAGWEATPTTGPSSERRATGDLPQPPTSPTSRSSSGTPGGWDTWRQDGRYTREPLPGWPLDEVAGPGRENLDANHVARYDGQEDGCSRPATWRAAARRRHAAVGRGL